MDLAVTKHALRAPGETPVSVTGDGPGRAQRLLAARPFRGQRSCGPPGPRQGGRPAGIRLGQRRTATRRGSRMEPVRWWSKVDLPCQTNLVVEGPGGGTASTIADELSAVRLRGIERIDVQSHNQSPLALPRLEDLADAYIAGRGIGVQPRPARLKFLLRDAIQAFSEQSREDAVLVRDLFFGDSLDRVTKTAGELLDTAMRKAGYQNKSRFRSASGAARIRLADFLPGFVEGSRHNAGAPTAGNGGRGPEARPAPPPLKETAPPVSVLPGLTPNSDHSVPEPEVEHHQIITGYVDNQQHYIRLLSECSSATIVGFTNERLTPMLRAALDRKRAATRPGAVWESLRIVFLNDNLLDVVNDERDRFPDPAERLRQRRRSAMHGRRSVSVFLRTNPAHMWQIRETSHFPPLIGTLFEMPDGRHLVQLIIRRPEPHTLYLELEDTRAHYFSQAFEEIINVSENYNKVVPWGRPASDPADDSPPVTGARADQRFLIGGERYRERVLRNDIRADGWLPLVLVITWRLRNGRAEPLLQLRTPLNAARELEHFSHLSGYVYKDDLAQGLTAFGLDDPGPLYASRRRVRMETAEDDPGEFRPLSCGRYFHPAGRENLLFFIFSCQFPAGYEPPEQAEMFALTIPELLQIRDNQVLRKALELCEAPPRRVATRAASRAAAFEIVSLNLQLHGRHELARELASMAGQPLADLSQLARDISQLEQQTRQAWPVLGAGEAEVRGLSGLQHREFFPLLINFYAEIGAPEAQESLRMLNGDVVRRLSGLYHDQGLMESIALEL